jgi:beta-glucosidase
MADYYGGEAGRNYLELNAAEEETLSMLEESFGTVVVVLNSTNAMELCFLKDEGVDAALWSGCFGSVGTVALGNILKGEADPSAKTVDTFAYEMESNPTFYSHGDYDYTNVSYENTAGAAGTGDAVCHYDLAYVPAGQHETDAADLADGAFGHYRRGLGHAYH